MACPTHFDTRGYLRACVRFYGLWISLRLNFKPRLTQGSQDGTAKKPPTSEKAERWIYFA